MPEKSDRDPAPAVTRALRILNLLADAQGAPMTLSDIARALDIAKSSTLNLVGVLEDGGMLQRVPQGYRLGRRTAELGGAFAVQFNQVREFFGVCDASEVLRTEVVQITMLDGTDTLYLARHEGRLRHRLGTPLGSRLPAALSASGNALLMRLDDDEIAELLRDSVPFPRLTENSVVDLDGLLAKVRLARERGYAVDANESVGGVSGIAVPLDPWLPSDPAFALGVAIPTELADEARIAEIGAALIAAAAELTNPMSIQGAPATTE
ncbi:IclR family transcriptional regulator [Pseudoclavibacter chungangensis]|uniref:IclR family transcriptional regulator n=1 Tax=Pseudoclavibacter chungangensis TaxID=587635 RepID=A0A7J5BWI9_9MICO|nr:IclR family transcriptional regulator [Pseudoclavibacter chungangensis]KAB1657921.1 IclR family transcriptional regulator [Pseudoclavibacter chungangensis]NYJ65932.1 DNA-binding IclR family transcriptional regulator [Pseudoclavibacter chungangensis]